ncbi:hypothetical protein D3C85_1260230 [compost metagenome]
MVRTFQIEIRRPLKLWAGLKHSNMTGTGIKPYVHDVCFFTELAMATFGTCCTMWKQIFFFLGKPSLGTFLLKQLGNMLDCLLVHKRLITAAAIENRDRNAPCALSGNTPVSTISDHVVKTNFAPFWCPFHLLDFIQHLLSELIDRREPLLRSTINYRLLRTPVVCILMLNVSSFKQ